MIWPRDDYASIAYAATERPNFLPLTCGHSSRGKKVRRFRPSLALRPGTGAASIPLGLAIAIEAAIGAGLKQRKED